MQNKAFKSLKTTFPLNKMNFLRMIDNSLLNFFTMRSIISAVNKKTVVLSTLYLEQLL